MYLPWHTVPMLDVGRRCKEVPDGETKQLLINILKAEILLLVHDLHQLIITRNYCQWAAILFLIGHDILIVAIYQAKVAQPYNNNLTFSLS